VPSERTSRPFTETLPELLHERGLSLRGLARTVGVGDDHLSRVVRGARGKRVAPELARRVSIALGLPADYFIEARLAAVVEELERDPALLDRIYDRMTKQRGS
jgi:transcriptional regulator with XRE-family HTH domain